MAFGNVPILQSEPTGKRGIVAEQLPKLVATHLRLHYWRSGRRYQANTAARLAGELRVLPSPT
jgi:hypothetical protein